MRARLAITLMACLALFVGCSKESRKARHLERANRYFQAGEFDKAEIEYGNVLRLEPAHRIAVTHLGFIYFDQGKPAKAFPLLKQAEALDPEAIEARVKLASLYLAGAKFKDVKAQAEYILQKDPGHDEALVFLTEAARTAEEMQAVRESLEAARTKLASDPGFHLALGNIAHRRKKTAEAEAAFKEAVRLGPRLAITHSMMGNFYALQGHLSSAEAAYKEAFELSPLRSTRRFDYIDFKVRNGDPAAGKKLLQETLQKAPDLLPALNRLAELTLGQKNYDECAALIQRVLSRDPQNYEALMTQALLHLAQADTSKAIAHLERLSAMFPSVPKVRYHLAVALLATNDVPDAVANLNQAIAQDPQFADPVLLLAEINIRKGDSGYAIALIEDLLKKRPQLADAHLLLANAHRMRNNLGEALAVYNRLAQIYPKNAQVPLFAGGVLLQQNKTNEARLSFEKSLQLSPDYLPALEQLISLDLAQRQFPAALNRLHKELERNPLSPQMHVLLAKTYYEQGQTNSVERELQRAIELDPLHREPYVLLAKLYVERNEHAQAIQRLKRVTARDPQDVPALMLLGVIYNQLNDYPSAREMYEQVLAVNPRFSPALNNLAYLYSEHLNQLDRAFHMAQRARMLMPWDGATADTLGWILFKREEYPWALSLLQESASKIPNQPEAIYHLGMAEYMMGYESAARLSFERALAMNKDFTGHDLCVRRLDILAVDVTRVDANALAALEAKLADDKNDPVALGKLAAAYENSGAVDKARQAYERALTLSPRNASVMTRLARLCAERLGDARKAMDLARRARALAPEDARIAHILGKVALDAGSPSEVLWANSLLQESARKLPDDPDVAYDLAWSQFSLGRFSEAQNALNAALASKPPFRKINEARLLLRFITEKPSEMDIQTTLERQPGYAPALFAAATRYEAKSDVLNAQKAYESILSRFPLFVPAHKRLAVIWDGQGDLTKAFQHATIVREHAPEDREGSRILGILAFKRGEFARSAQLLRETVRQGSSDAEAFYYLGMAHYRLKQKAESREALRQAVSLNVAASLAQEANRVLAEIN